MKDYTLTLALFDFLPVTASATGLFLLHRYSRRFAPIAAVWLAAGATLVVTGGLLKATWKLLVVTTSVDHRWMSDALFYCLGPGFFILAGGVLAMAGAARGAGGHAWPIAGTVLAVIGAAGTWTLDLGSAPLLVMMVVGNLCFMVVLIRAALREQVRAAAGLLALALTTTFVMSGLARIPDQTAAVQWVAEIVNTIGQGSFAVGLFLLWQQITQPSSREATA